MVHCSSALHSSPGHKRGLAQLACDSSGCFCRGYLSAGDRPYDKRGNPSVILLKLNSQPRNQSFSGPSFNNHQPSLRLVYSPSTSSNRCSPLFTQTIVPQPLIVGHNQPLLLVIRAHILLHSQPDLNLALPTSQLQPDHLPNLNIATDTPPQTPGLDGPYPAGLGHFATALNDSGSGYHSRRRLLREAVPSPAGKNH